MKKRWGIYLIVFLLVFSSSYASKKSADLDLYNKDKGFELVGTSSGGGKYKSISPGEVLRINLSNVVFNEDLNTGGNVEIEIINKGQVVDVITGTVNQGVMSRDFRIPENYHGNYHVTAIITWRGDKLNSQAEFKVETNCQAEIETCDGKDNDCDGLVDENTDVRCGLTDLGTCEYGIKKCVNGAFGKCQGAIDPDVEICNGLDDDCDGLTDEALERSCGQNVGLCVSGTQTCSNGTWNSCSGMFKGPEKEICNGLDDDCDGEVDNGIICNCHDGETRPCGSDIGECTFGIQTCNFGQWGMCKGGLQPKIETCNGLDDDCDGETDENLIQNCGTNTLGECKQGVQVCLTGNWGKCTGEVKPKPEVCDNIDNDCDGKTDESVTQSCGTDIGECKEGFQLCSAGQFGICQNAIGPVTEVCDGLDNDCDGHTDNGITDIETGTDVGECQKRIQVCQGGSLITLQDQVLPVTEICDGLDNDCDGETDEGLSTITGNNTGACIEGIKKCTNGQYTIIQKEIKSEQEYCDGKDNDCDGEIDEEINCQCINNNVQECGIDVGVCEKGTQTCINGKYGSCSGSIEPSKEICDGLDNDCDGEIDENLETEKGTDAGICQKEKTKCIGGTYIVVQPGVEGEKEICDGLDNDCDGEIDEDIKIIEHGSDIGLCQKQIKKCINGSFFITQDEIQEQTEICDGLDNDCDGEIDEELVQNCGNEQGVCQSGIKTCSSGQWGLCVGEILGGKEICNGLDDDCDGETDESLTQKCGTDIGECKQGYQVCSNGQYGLCVGAVESTQEICDGKDNDCNGLIDDGINCQCSEGDTRQCGTDIGQCESGLQLCVNGKWGACNGGIQPVTEICDGLDNDCDGQIDQDLKQYFGHNQGKCEQGIKECINGVYQTTKESVGPTQELCNGIDDDCDGEIDEELVKICGFSGYGECKLGLQSCIAGVWGLCEGEITPETEKCDGLDNDCDGIIDDEVTLTCGTDVGECKKGHRDCENGIFAQCVGAIHPQTEVCDGLDNDCDGEIDEELDCKCSNGQTRRCGTNEGLCEKGTQTCVDGNWGSCIGEITGEEEQCDGFDNDCDGEIDEGILPVAFGSSQGQCAQEILECKYGGYITVQNQAEPTEEICDGLDNDCDGETDEGIPENYTGTEVGQCVKQITGCKNGNYGILQQGILPQEEICDGIDNDCDGLTDENLDQTNGTDIGECRKEIAKCDEGKYELVQTGVYPQTEICDGKDNDCDGEIDEQLTCQCTGNEQRECGVGRCTKGLQTCVNGTFGECVGAENPTEEICDGKDNDCDGEIDEGIQNILEGNNSGICKSKITQCVNGSHITIQEMIGAQTEICNGLDDDCDGEIDDGLTIIEGNETGVCKPQIKECVNSNYKITHERIDPAEEVCDNIDNDCDGEIDEGCSEPVERSIKRKKFDRSRDEATPPSSSVEPNKNDAKPISKVKTETTPVKAEQIKKGLELVIGKVPDKITFDDSKIIVKGAVKNIGDSKLNGVTTFAVADQWMSSKGQIDELYPNEEKYVEFEINPRLCDPEIPSGEYTIDKESLNVFFEAQAEKIAKDTERARIPFELETFGISPIVTNDQIKVCYFVNNRDERTKQYEIEFELLDREDDLVIDYISPVTVKGNETLLKVRDYKMSYIPRTKDYTLRSHLYEGGNVFTEKYIASDDQARIDLVKKGRLNAISRWIQNIRKKMR